MVGENIMSEESEATQSATSVPPAAHQFRPGQSGKETEEAPNDREIMDAFTKRNSQRRITSQAGAVVPP
jgi:hypothetical protein